MYSKTIQIITYSIYTESSPVASLKRCEEGLGTNPSEKVIYIEVDLLSYPVGIKASMILPLLLIPSWADIRLLPEWGSIRANSL